MSSWLFFAFPAPAALLVLIAFLAYRWFWGSRRLLAKVVAAGSEERGTLRQRHPEIPLKAPETHTLLESCGFPNPSVDAPQIVERITRDEDALDFGRPPQDSGDESPGPPHTSDGHGGPAKPDSDDVKRGARQSVLSELVVPSVERICGIMAHLVGPIRSDDELAAGFGYLRPAHGLLIALAEPAPEVPRAHEGQAGGAR